MSLFFVPAVYIFVLMIPRSLFMLFESSLLDGCSVHRIYTWIYQPTLLANCLKYHKLLLPK